MDIQLNDRLVMKKSHPCGCNTFKVKRIGIDFKLICEKCSHEIIIPRVKAEKNVRKIIKTDGE
ncbi:MAG: DUF951 domain-containing protein [Clostridia bacterium]|nr:DUF951 domain-containing protein [Clostridia bacterium]